MGRAQRSLRLERPRLAKSLSLKPEPSPKPRPEPRLEPKLERRAKLPLVQKPSLQLLRQRQRQILRLQPLSRNLQERTLSLLLPLLLLSPRMLATLPPVRRRRNLVVVA